MIYAILLALVAVVALYAVLAHQNLRTEQARVNDLLRLVQAKAAPAETAAYLLPAPLPEEEPRYLWSEDGLIGVRTEPEPE